MAVVQLSRAEVEAALERWGLVTYRTLDSWYWCADLPPEYSSQDGTWTGYRLDGDKTHTASTLKRYGRHKAWIDPFYKFEGKPVILVYNAS